MVEVTGKTSRVLTELKKRPDHPARRRREILTTGCAINEPDQGEHRQRLAVHEIAPQLATQHLTMIFVRAQ